MNPGEGFDVRGEVKCDACNHRKHQPIFAIQFKGKAYHKDTLEEVEQDSEDDDDETKSVNSQDQDIPNEDKEWFVGRYVAFFQRPQGYTPKMCHVEWEIVS